MNYDEKCQLLIIGDSTVGKTSLLFRYTEDKFSTQHLATVGIDFFTKDEIFDGKTVRIKVWDTAGQERYKSLTNAFFRNAQGIILVFDVSNAETYENLKYWLQSINTNLGEKSDIKKIIIGNKIDLPREVSKEEAQKFAKNSGVVYFEASAKDNIGIIDSIRFIIEDILRDKIMPPGKDSIRITTRQTTVKEESKCKC
jgi:small GTP-binding protein